MVLWTLGTQRVLDFVFCFWRITKKSRIQTSKTFGAAWESLFLLVYLGLFCVWILCLLVSVVVWSLYWVPAHDYVYYLD